MGNDNTPTLLSDNPFLFHRPDATLSTEKLAPDQRSVIVPPDG